LRGAAFGAINSWSSTDVIKMSRKDADLLVGQSGLDKSHYRASGGHKARWGEDWRLGEDESLTARSLFVSGFVFDVIGQATDKSQSGVTPKEWLEIGKWKAGKDPPPSHCGVPCSRTEQRTAVIVAFTGQWRLVLRLNRTIRTVVSIRPRSSMTTRAASSTKYDIASRQSYGIESSFEHVELSG